MVDVNKCPYYENFFGTCKLYVTECDNYDDLGWEDSKCKDVEDCDFKCKGI